MNFGFHQAIDGGLYIVLGGFHFVLVLRPIRAQRACKERPVDDENMLQSGDCREQSEIYVMVGPESYLTPVSLFIPWTPPHRPAIQHHMKVKP